MTERVLGEKGSTKRKRFLLLPALVITTAFAMFWIVGAQAEPGGGVVFELDASLDPNATPPPPINAAVTDNTTAGLPDDWDRIAADFGLATNGASTSNADASSFDAETKADGTADATTIFTGGGSKDQQPLNKWAYKNQLGGLPDKDNLLHGMAGRYNDVNGGNDYVFFGADRFDNSGDAQIGFWFFKTTVCTKADGSFGNTLTGTTCSGTAVHTPGVVPHNTSDPTKQGDILVLSDFTNGGTQPTIRIFEYVGSAAGSSDGTLNLIGGGVDENRDCAVVSTDDFCASVNNNDGAVAPWLFKNKSGQTSFGHGEFYEGGLNLNSLGLQNECFSSFLAETRSSQSVTATLKDFILGGFEACNASVTTTPVDAQGTAQTSIGLGSDIYDHAVITGTGSNQNPTGTMDFYICSPAQLTNGVCSSGGTEVNGPVGQNSVTVTPIANSSNSEATSSKFTPAAVGTWCWRGEYSGDNRYPAASDSSLGECFTVTQIQPTISTAQTYTLKDSATISASGGGNLAGHVRFRLYTSTDCTTGLVYDSNTNFPNGIAVSGASPKTVDSETITFTATQSNLSWLVEYTSTNQAQKNVTSTCNTEHSNLSITNG